MNCALRTPARSAPTRGVPARGAPARGAANGRARFNDADVRRMRAMYWDEGLTQEQIADGFDCRQNVVSRIVKFKAWSHVT